MPPWLTDVLKLLEFTTPFVYAAATYGVFRWLDKKASGVAKKELTQWLRNEPRIDVSRFITESFDRLYSYPLWRWKAFGRSALVTLIVSTLIWYELNILENEFFGGEPISLVAIVVIAGALLFNVLSDYVSLFVVRKLLDRARRAPILSSLLGPLLGAVVVYLFAVLRWVTISVWGAYDMYPELTRAELAYEMSTSPRLWQLSATILWSVYPALAVHLWLPLVGLASVGARGLTATAKAANLMLWFLRQGQHHPFEAVGYVATAIVFLVMVGVQLMLN